MQDTDLTTLDHDTLHAQLLSARNRRDAGQPGAADEVTLLEREATRRREQRGDIRYDRKETDDMHDDTDQRTRADRALHAIPPTAPYDLRIAPDTIVEMRPDLYETDRLDAAAEHGTNEHYTIRCFASGDEAEADTAEAALVAADQLARDYASAPGRNLKTAREQLAIYLNGSWHNALTGLARAGYRAPLSAEWSR